MREEGDGADDEARRTMTRAFCRKERERERAKSELLCFVFFLATDNETKMKKKPKNEKKNHFPTARQPMSLLQKPSGHSIWSTAAYAAA